MISGGKDRVVRYWNLQNPSKSFRISNTTPNISYTYKSWKDKKYNEVVLEELIEYEEQDFDNINDNTNNNNEYKDNYYNSSNNYRNNRTNINSLSKSIHQDIITDIKAIQYPQNMLLTSSRNGIVKVWI